MINKMLASGVFNHLAGFEEQDGTGNVINFIFSNGARSTQKAAYLSDRLIPADALNKIRSVTIHYDGWIVGFSFFDKDGLSLWRIGKTTDPWLK